MSDALILTGPDGLGAALRERARLVLDEDARWGALLPSLAPHERARLYVPPCFADAAPEARVVIACPADGSPVFPVLRRHALRFRARGAVLLRPIALRVLLRPDAPAECSPLTEPPPEHGCFSPAALCECSAAAEGDAVRAVLFDSARSLARRRALCRRLGLECLVLLD